MNKQTYDLLREIKSPDCYAEQRRQQWNHSKSRVEQHKNSVLAKKYKVTLKNFYYKYYYSHPHEWLKTVNNFQQGTFKLYTRQELYTMATENRIPSRSHMTKRQLIVALIKL